LGGGNGDGQAENSFSKPIAPRLATDNYADEVAAYGCSIAAVPVKPSKSERFRVRTTSAPAFTAASAWP
jgi:hypothetical protein